MERCKECYSELSFITPLINPMDCLSNHTQYICGTCGRCICIEKTERTNLQRWNFPFKSLEIAMLYLRTAEFTLKRPCGIYEIITNKRKEYHIFESKEKILVYQKNHPTKVVSFIPLFINDTYKEYPYTNHRKLSSLEVQTYLEKRKNN